MAKWKVGDVVYDRLDAARGVVTAIAESCSSNVIVKFDNGDSEVECYEGELSGEARKEDK